MFKTCHWCKRTVPVRPGSFAIVTSHVCRSFIYPDFPAPYGLKAQESSPETRAAMSDTSLFMDQASSLGVSLL